MELNGLGPVGIYIRDTPYVIPGYQSLKQWEQQSGTPCKLIIAAGTYNNIARFIKQSREREESWVVSSLSFTGAEELQLDLEEYGVTRKVIMTQVVPLLDSQLPIVEEAKEKLGEKLGYISLEGYIVGKMTLEILKAIPGEINRESFLEQVAKSRFDLGGVMIDFTQGNTQASDLVVISFLSSEGFIGLNKNELFSLFQ
jgi:hypothetical protein